MSLCFHPFKELIHGGLHNRIIFLSDLLYGNFSRGLRDDGPYLYCLPPLVVLLDAGADGAAAASVFFRACL